MRRIHLLRVEGPPEPFAGLIAAARRRGVRVGWLESVEPAPLPASLTAAAAAGAPAVAAGGGLVTAVKPLAGAAVLKDLLRTHFLGCIAVLVAGDLGPAEAPRLLAEDGGWRIETPGGEWRLETEALLDRLRRPAPWD